MQYVIDLHQLTREEWDACNCTENLGMSYEAFHDDKDEKIKLGEAVSFMRALDVLPFARFLNQDNAMLRVNILNRKLRLKRAETVFAAFKEGLHVIKTNPQNLAVLFKTGVFKDTEEFKQAEADLGQLLGSNHQLTGRDDPKLEDRASRLLVACIGLVLEVIDRRLEKIPLVTAAPAAPKARSIRVYMAENEQLKTKLEKRTREVRDLKRALKDLADAQDSEGDDDESNTPDSSDDDDQAAKRQRSGEASDSDE